MQRQRKAPLWAALLDHVQSQYDSFHVPGHKGGAGIPPELLTAWGRSVFSFDLTELPDLDNLHAPEGAILQAETLAAELYRARATFFLVGGTSSGLVAALLSSTRPGDKVLIPRHAHRAVLSACILGDLNPVFYSVRVNKEWGLPGGWDEANAELLIRQNPSARALVLVHPTYHGLVGQTRRLIAAAHAAGLTVIADEAHGPHFYFHEGLPEGALELGADLVAQSVHKLLGSLTQSSWLHLAGPVPEPSRVREGLRWLESSSPSYLLLASLDLARRQAALTGHGDWEQTLELARGLREGIGRVDGIQCLDARAWPGVTAQDPTKLTLNVRSLGLSGREAAAFLRETHGIQVELADAYNLLFVLTPADSLVKGQRLLDALTDLVCYQGGSRCPLALDLPDLPEPRVRLSPRSAVFAAKRKLALEVACGRVAAQAVVPYPPGVPLLWPGEEIGPEVVEVVKAYYRAGIQIQGLEFRAAEHLVAVVEE
ncbi:MAG: decarboxylase [Firmicutes bacterium]|nr:decarboxylase [Bacillota bacterium]